jgi:hypothetical protein
VRALIADPRIKTRSAVFATSAGCPPVPYANRIDPGFACDKFFDYAVSQAKSPEIDTVIFGAAWEAYFLSQPSGDSPRNAIYRVGKSSNTPLTIESPDADDMFKGLERVVEALRKDGKRVYIILPNPTSPAFSPGSMLPSRVGRGTAPRGQPYVSRTEFAAAIKPVTDRLRALAAVTGAHVIDPMDYFCEPEICRTVNADGMPLYRDSNHMRPFYVREKAAFIDGMLAE